MDLAQDAPSTLDGFRTTRMTAPAINPAMNVLPGLAGGGNGQAATGGALAGFEALMAALFGNVDIAGVPNVQTAGAQTPAAPANALFAPIGESASDPASPDPVEAGDAEAGNGQAGAEVVLDPLLMAQAATPAPASAAPTGSDTAPTATGQDTVKAAPASPAPDQADPHAQVAEQTAVDGQPEAAAPTGPAAAQVAKAQTPAEPPRGAPAGPAPAATDTHMAADAAAEAPVPPVPPAEPATPAPEPLAVETSQAAQAAEITKAADAPPPPPAAPKRKERSAEAVRSEPGQDMAAAPKAEGAAARTPTAAAPAAGDAKTDAVAKGPGFNPAEAESKAPDAAGGAEPSTSVSDTRSTHASGAAASPGAHPVRGAPETVANLAAQIVKKLDGRSTRFDVELDPIGLGKVDVRVEIGAHGRVTAAMTFENPQAAAELKSRSGELQRALEQAGFDLAGGGMSFDVAGGGGQARQEWAQDRGGAFRGRAFQQALETAGEADLAAASGELRLRRGVTGGVDVRI